MLKKKKKFFRAMDGYNISPQNHAKKQKKNIFFRAMDGYNISPQNHAVYFLFYFIYLFIYLFISFFKLRTVALPIWCLAICLGWGLWAGENTNYVCLNLVTC